MSSPADLRYTKEHEWARVESDGVVTIGITDHAQDALGDVVYVELPEAGESFDVDAKFGVVESVKTVSDLFAPMAGTVVDVNAALEDAPELVNSEPYGAGWMIRIEPSDADAINGLMDAAAYEAHVDAESA